ncbi:DedA family protein [Kroppenstedtia eburnea]|uniref:DedA family protein n=1 Tax=Kroppenstedtia eburnea TaxID=714067 RepID=UPI00020C8B9C|nr:DedA family protein [Desmospora sp. 8437]
MTEALLNWVVHFGYIGLFAALVLGIVGLPIPDELLMTFAGFLISKNHFHLFHTVVVAFAGSVAGMSLSFTIGRRLGRPFLERYGPYVHLTPKRLEQAEEWFQRFGKWAVSFGYFIPGVRHLTAYSAGISRWPFPVFILYAFTGGLIWVLTYITVGILLGEHWKQWMGIFHRTGWIGAATLVLVIGVLWWMKRKRADPS